jgi:hypothetical protein
MWTQPLPDPTVISVVRQEASWSKTAYRCPFVKAETEYFAKKAGSLGVHTVIVVSSKEYLVAYQRFRGAWLGLFV